MDSTLYTVGHRHVSSSFQYLWTFHQAWSEAHPLTVRHSMTSASAPAAHARHNGSTGPPATQNATQATPSTSQTVQAGGIDTEGTV
jgi:hypothetical protein